MFVQNKSLKIGEIYFLPYEKVSRSKLFNNLLAYRVPSQGKLGINDKFVKARRQRSSYSARNITISSSYCPHSGFYSDFGDAIITGIGVY